MKSRYYCIRCTSPVHRPVDHRKPRSLGGSDWIGNIQPVCVKCHQWKTEHTHLALREGYTLARWDTERDWRIDFPFAVVPNPVI